ncbi:hypothetical protein EDO6_05426 [Paenibacillus xylanexedens]|nr:hypothetical protein EDO6_05426 [Paenibacillus xylanexedens]
MTEQASDRCYPQIFFDPFSKGENPVIKASVSLLQLPSALSVFV